MNFLVHFSNGISLEYQLVDCQSVEIWKNTLSHFDINDKSEFNHFVGFLDEELIQSRIDKLNSIADKVNAFAPGRVNKIPIDRENWRFALNSMHTHFPDLLFKEGFESLKEDLSDYNHLIHWLETELTELWPIDKPVPVSKTTRMRINFDFHGSTKLSSQRSDIPEEDFKLFTPFVGFGILTLNYAHVGRHPMELFYAKDFTCPKEQFVPQSKISANFGLHMQNRVFDNPEFREIFNERWKKFYAERGGFDFFGMEIDDPKMSFGNLKIGDMVAVHDNGRIFSTPTDQDSIEALRSRLVKSKSTGWEFV